MTVHLTHLGIKLSKNYDIIASGKRILNYNLDEPIYKCAMYEHSNDNHVRAIVS